MNVCRPGRRARLARALWLLTPLLGGGCAAFTPLPAGPGASVPKSAAERDLLDLIPAPVEAVLLVDVARLRGSVWSRPVFAWAVERQRTSSGRQGFRGFDEIVDVDRWVFARSGQASLELAEGRFDRKAVESTFRSKRPGSTIERQDKLQIEIDPPGNDGVGPARAFAFLTGRRVVFGNPPQVRAATAVALDQTGAEAGAASLSGWLSAARTALIDEVGPGRDAAVELLLMPTPPVRQELAGLTGGVEPRLSHLAARLVLSREARLSLVAVASDRAEARRLADGLGQRLRALAGRRSLRALGLAPAVERARVTVRGARLVLEVVVTDAERDGVAGRLAELAEILGRSGDAPPAGEPGSTMPSAPESEVKEPPPFSP